MDAFGLLELDVYQNPGEQLSEDQVERYTEITQSAFTRAEPDRENVEEHVFADTLVEARIDGEAVGFSGTDYLDSKKTVLGSGMAVDPDYQENGIGSLIRTRGVMGDIEEGGYFAARSANPSILSHMQDQYKAFPREDLETPEAVEEAMHVAAEEIDSSRNFEAPVMENAYPEQMNEMPDHELSDFLEELMDEKGQGYDEGDALIMAAEVSEPELQEAYDQLVNEAEFEVREEVM